MEKSKNFFIKIDEFIFQKLDLLKAEGNFQKLNEPFSNLDENQQKIVAQIFTFSLLFIPYVFVISLWWGNHSSKNRAEVKNQILEQISILNSNRDTLANAVSSYLSPVPILSQDDLSSKLNNILASAQIEQSKVTVTNFNQISTTSSIAKIEAVINFRDFGTQDFSLFMKSLTESEKFKILRLNLVRNKTTSLLQGEISLIHLGKNTAF
jgi:hypothetical protein